MIHPRVVKVGPVNRVTIGAGVMGHDYGPAGLRALIDSLEAAGEVAWPEQFSPAAIVRRERREARAARKAFTA